METKIKNIDEIVRLSDELRNKKNTIVFTNGCFDIIHTGHVFYLKRARDIGDVLIVGVNSDKSIRRIKGEKRPINKERDRAIILASFYFVDYVIIFTENTPINLIKAVKPDILIKGGDWRNKEVAGKDFVESYGGVCKFIDFLDGESTTLIIERIINAYCF